MMHQFLLIALLVSAASFASGNICLYNGKKHDDREGKIQNFTGEMTCTDSVTGKLTIREKWVNGKQDGPYSKYSSVSGKLDESGSYRLGKLHGVLKRFHDAGDQYLEYSYEDGETAGVQKEMADGVVTRMYLAKSDPMVELYFNKKGQLTNVNCGTKFIGKDDVEWCGHNGKQSTVKLYDEEGQLSEVVQYLWGKQHGTYKKYNVVTGKVIEESKYVNGVEQKDGQRAYNRDGDLRFKSDCDEKRKKCTETRFFAEGKEPQTVTTWLNGKEAKYVEYYQNGKPSEEREAVGDKFKITEYSDTGKVRSRGMYVKSTGWYWRSYIPDGQLETFWDSGKHWRKENYQGGKRQGRAEYFWKQDSDELRGELEFKNDIRIREKLFLNGKLVEESEYAPDGSLKKKKQHAPNPVDWEI